jgi:hypothetical protein
MRLDLKEVRTYGRVWSQPITGRYEFEQIQLTSGYQPAKSRPAKHPSRHSRGAGFGHRERAVTELLRDVSARHEHNLAELTRFTVPQRTICG